MRILDPCDEPVSLYASFLSDQRYTISQKAFDYDMPAFVSDPAWCDIEYSYTVTATEGDNALAFDSSKPQFTFFEPSNLALSGDSFEPYMVTVVAQVGNVNHVEATGSFTLEIWNPCIDSRYF